MVETRLMICSKVYRQQFSFLHSAAIKFGLRLDILGKSFTGFTTFGRRETSARRKFWAVGRNLCLVVVYLYTMFTPQNGSIDLQAVHLTLGVRVPANSSTWFLAQLCGGRRGAVCGLSLLHKWNTIWAEPRCPTTTIYGMWWGLTFSSSLGLW